METAAEVEAECPVCLQSYDGDQTIPRVLNCGHSACESCLSLLPQIHDLTIRCPSCNVLVKLPSLGPTSLPKNIDLLRLLNHSDQPKPTKPYKSTSLPSRFHFLPPSWSRELYSHWSPFILQRDAILQFKVPEDGSSLSLATLNDRSVSLFKVACIVPDSVFKYGYVGSIIKCLAYMTEQCRDHLDTVVRFSGVLGFWADLDGGCLFLVCQKLRLGLENWDGCGFGDSRLCLFANMGMEICEELIGLNRKGLVAGCLGFSSFDFDNFGHLHLDVNDVLATGGKIAKRFESKQEVGVLLCDLLKRNVFFAPEVLFELLGRKGIGEFEFAVDYSSDVWSVASVLIRILVGEMFTEEMVGYVHCASTEVNEENSLDWLVGMYTGWMDKVSSLLRVKLGAEVEFLQQMFCSCLIFEATSRPSLIDVWKCIRRLIVEPEFDNIINSDNAVNIQKKSGCLVLSEICLLPKQNGQTQGKDGLSQAENSTGADSTGVEAAGDANLIEGISEKKLKFKILKGHLDCVTGLAVGGEFLFSSSYDKSVQVWSLKDFSHIHTFKGHEHKVMAIVYADEEVPLCISGDNGGGICVWCISVPLNQEPLKKWNEQKDWLYSGIHAMAVSGNYLYTGSGDKTIKAWSLKDTTLSCVMDGHKSVVSALAVCNGILYSGSWDGTIRLWSLSDHSLLTVLGEDSIGTMSSVMSLAVDQHTLVASYENGSIKVWRDDVFMKSAQIHSGTIFGIWLEEKWLFTGGWDQNVSLQELIGDEFHVDTIPIGSIPCDSVITALLYWQGKVFVALANRTLKVYYYEK